MELVKDPPYRPNASEKAVERFVNGSIGFRPGCDNPEATFYSQRLYDYAKEIVDNEPQASTQQSRFHFTKGHLKQSDSKDTQECESGPTCTDFLRTNRVSILMKTPRISDDPFEKERRRSSFNSAYELSKMNKAGASKMDWQRSDYRFQCADRKQEYSALDDFNEDMFISRTRKHEYRSHKPERPVCDRSFDLNRKPNQLQVIRVSMLENPNYVNKEKYKFPVETPKKPRLSQYPRIRETSGHWKQYYHKDGHLIEQSKISILLQEKAKREEVPEDVKLQLMNRPLKSDALERQRDLSQCHPDKTICRGKRATSTRFFNYPRGVYDILYPRSIIHG